jgi:hypothetical protein
LLCCELSFLYLSDKKWKQHQMPVSLVVQPGFYLSVFKQTAQHFAQLTLRVQANAADEEPRARDAQTNQRVETDTPRFRGERLPRGVNSKKVDSIEIK